LSAPHGVEVIGVRTAVEMREGESSRTWSRPASSSKPSAVGDFHLSKCPIQKRTENRRAAVAGARSHAPISWPSWGRKKGDRLLVASRGRNRKPAPGKRARKLESKNCDMVVGNLVGGADVGFESDENEVVLAAVDRRNAGA